MRIAMLPDYFLPHIGGMELWTFHVSRQLVNMGHKVVVFTYKTTTRKVNEEMDGVQVCRVGYPYINKPHSYFPRALSQGIGLPKALFKKRSDAYIATYSPLLVCKALRISPLFAVWHGYYGPRYALRAKGLFRGAIRSWIEYAALHQNVDRIIAVSGYLKKLLLWANPKIDSDNVHVLSGGIDSELIDSVHVKEKKFQICFVGRLEYDKCPGHVLEAFHRIHKEFPGLKLIIVGGGSLKYRLKEMSRKKYMDCADRVKFIGYVSEKEKIRFLKESLILVRPSIMDAFPLTTLESLACETPFVAYDIPPLREQVKKTMGGILVERKNVNALAEAMKRLLENQKMLDQLSRTSAERVRNTYDWKKVASKLEDIIRSTIEF